MNIFQILSALYTQTNAKWMKDVNPADVSPMILNRWIAMNDGVRKYARWLDKYVYVLPPKMFLSLAWSILPKMNKAPFVKYIKQIKDDDEFYFIFEKVRKQYEISDNDFETIKPFLVKAIRKDMPSWFAYYGLKKSHWTKYHLDYNLLKEFRHTEGKPEAKGLEAWGL